MSKNLLILGNKKVDSSVWLWSLPPVVTCPNCASCCKTCYALKAYRLYANVRKSWNENLELSKTDDFITLMTAEIKAKKLAYVRIHQSGDFYGVDYINRWTEIAKQNPGTMFWTYTKAYGVNEETNTALSTLAGLPNVNIVKSTFAQKINFGDEDYIYSLKNEIETAEKKCFVCECGTPNEKKCGKECNACAHYEYVLFRKH